MDFSFSYNLFLDRYFRNHLAHRIGSNLSQYPPFLMYEKFDTANPVIDYSNPSINLLYRFLM